jgi:tRNA A37 threonylcarbamoyladenosine dehydratase
MGAAGKFDAQAVRLADISKTSGCPLARVVRKKLRERGINRGVGCVFSEESAIPGPPGEKPGSLSYVVCAFGTLCAQSVISDVMRTALVSDQSSEE